MSGAVAGRLRLAIVVQIEDAPVVCPHPEVEPPDAPRAAAGGRRQMGRRHIVGHAAAALVAGPGRQDVEDAVGALTPDKRVRRRRFLGQRRGTIVKGLDLGVDEAHGPPGVVHGEAGGARVLRPYSSTSLLPSLCRAAMIPSATCCGTTS